MGVNAVPEDITTGEEITEGVDGSTPDSVDRFSTRYKFKARELIPSGISAFEPRVLFTALLEKAFIDGDVSGRTSYLPGLTVDVFGPNKAIQSRGNTDINTLLSIVDRNNGAAAGDVVVVTMQARDERIRDDAVSFFQLTKDGLLLPMRRFDPEEASLDSPPEEN